MNMLEAREKYIAESQWTIGFKDRGLGRGDFAIILKHDYFDWSDWTSSTDCYLKNWSIPVSLQSVAESIVEKHNKQVRLDMYGTDTELEDIVEELQFDIDNGLIAHIDYLEIDENDEGRRDQIRNCLELRQLEDESETAIQDRYFRFCDWAGDREDEYAIEIQDQYFQLLKGEDE